MGFKLTIAIVDSFLGVGGVVKVKNGKKSSNFLLHEKMMENSGINSHLKKISLCKSKLLPLEMIFLLYFSHNFSLIRLETSF